MARPKKNNADYFPHDADMRNDPKVRAIRRKFGLKGYAVWSMLLETLTDKDYFKLKWSPLDVELIAADMEVSPDELKDMVEYMVNVLELLKMDNGFIFSPKLISRFETLLNKRKRDRNKANKELSTAKTPNKEQTGAENPQSKVKESKVKESKVKTLEERKADFKKSLSPFLANYSKDLLNEFYAYWVEKNPRGVKFRFEKEKTFDLSRRLATWEQNNKKWAAPGKQIVQHEANEQVAEKLKQFD
ncbi:uncharacterized protein DUF4373 [Thalassospira sp. 11-3]|nr:uncharacterized protein DUF4373 [Thalassospira sp. 11-3]